MSRQIVPVMTLHMDDWSREGLIDMFTYDPNASVLPEFYAVMAVSRVSRALSAMCDEDTLYGWTYSPINGVFIGPAWPGAPEAVMLLMVDTINAMIARAEQHTRA